MVFELFIEDYEAPAMGAKWGCKAEELVDVEFYLALKKASVELRIKVTMDE